jgi:hypothetical protein
MIKFTEQFFTINHGNTNTSLMLHDQDHSRVITPEEYFSNDYLKTIPGVVSSVGSKEVFFPQNIQDINLYHQDNYFLDMKVHYAQSLGVDRLINAYYIYQHELCPAEKILHIDAGTFTTMDLISLNGFEGGYIFPGEETYLKSFSNGADLPVFKTTISDVDIRIPRNTEQAIKQSYTIFMKGALIEVLSAYAPQSIIVTGGGSINIVFLLSLLNNSPENKFVKYKSMPKLTHKALKFFYHKIQKDNLQ